MYSKNGNDICAEFSQENLGKNEMLTKGKVSMMFSQITMEDESYGPAAI